MIVQKPLVLKVNGFSHGLSRYQIFSYITLFLQTLLFSSFIVPNFIKSAQITLSILYYMSLAIVAIAGFKATITDPTDELVYMERRLKLEGKHVDETLYSFQCNSCETSVNENSKHCRVCDRCVKDFDHHCIWINNCVSKKNYNAFLIATIFLTLATGVFAIAGLLFIIDYYTKALGIVLDNTVKKGDKVDEWKAILMVIFTVIAGVVTLMCMRLIIFHMYLIRNKITTYDYIMQKREQKSDTKKIKVTQEIKLTKVAPLWTVGNKTPENDEENINVKSHSQRSERQSTERGILPETHITLGSGVNTRRGSKTSDNKITSIDNANLRKELAAEQLKEGEDGSGKKWRFRVFQNRASPPKYSNLMSPTNLEYVTSAELGRNTPLSGDPTGSRGSPIGDNDHRNFDSKFSTPVPNEDSDEKEGQEKITSD